MTAPLLLASCPVWHEAVLHSCGTSLVCGTDLWQCILIHGNFIALDHQATSTMTCYPTQSNYSDTEPTRLRSDDFKFWSHWFDSTRVWNCKVWNHTSDLQIPCSPRMPGGPSIHSATLTGQCTKRCPCIIYPSHPPHILLAFLSLTCCRQNEVVGSG